MVSRSQEARRRDSSLSKIAGSKILKKICFLPLEKKLSRLLIVTWASSAVTEFVDPQPSANTATMDGGVPTLDPK